MITIRITVQNQETLAALRAARGDLNKSVRLGLVESARLAVSPAQGATNRKSGELAGGISPGATSRAAFLQVRGVPQAGLLNFGGTRRDTIRPHAARALSLPFGARASVSGPRTYAAKRFLERGVEQVASQIREKLLEAAVAPYRRYLGGS